MFGKNFLPPFPASSILIIPHVSDMIVNAQIYLLLNLASNKSRTSPSPFNAVLLYYYFYIFRKISSQSCDYLDMVEE